MLLSGTLGLPLLLHGTAWHGKVTAGQGKVTAGHCIHSRWRSAGRQPHHTGTLGSCRPTLTLMRATQEGRRTNSWEEVIKGEKRVWRGSKKDKTVKGIQ